MRLEALDEIPEAEACEALLRCCGSTAWAHGMAAARPFGSLEGLEAEAERLWWSLLESDWREAFAAHPRIGDLESLKHRFAATAPWAHGEQRGAAGAAPETLQALAEGNDAYERRFGYIFIVCATGRSAGEMLDLLRARLGNESAAELRLAAAEQMKITRLRLRKLLEGDL